MTTEHIPSKKEVGCENCMGRGCNQCDPICDPKPDKLVEMRKRMLRDEDLSDEDFVRFSRVIALEAHEDRLKLWEARISDRLKMQVCPYCAETQKCESTHK